LNGACSHVDMSLMYVCDDSRFETFATFAWYDAVSLAEFVSRALQADFQLVQQRRLVLDRLRSCRLEAAPYGAARRYAPGAYVCSVWGDWEELFAQLSDALAYEAHNAFCGTLSVMRLRLQELHGVVLRSDFERELGAVWTPERPGDAKVAGVGDAGKQLK